MACILPSKFRSENGFGEGFFNSIRKNLNDTKVSVDELRSLVRNLGIDDVRALELRKGKGHLFGKNLRDIKEWNRSKGDVPANVLVKMRDADGNIEHYVSNRKTSLRPSKMIVQDNGHTKINPDWSFVGKNQTMDSTGALRKYTVQDDGTYKQVGEEDNTLLKIGKVFDGTGKTPSNQELAEQGYDAVKIGEQHYRLLDPPNQAVDPEFAFVRSNQTPVEPKANKTTPEDVKSDEGTEKISRELESLGVGRAVAQTAGGILGGEIVDAMAGTDGGAWVGGSIGLALAFPSVRNSMKSMVKGSDNSFKGQVKTVADAEAKADDALLMKESGYKGSMENEEEVGAWKRFMNSKDKLRSAGKSAFSTFFDNDYLMSMSTLFSNLKVKAGNELFDKFYRSESAHSIFAGDYEDAITKRFGNLPKDDFKAMQADEIRSYLKANNLEGEFSDDELLERFGESVFRIITHQSKLDEAGKLVTGADGYTAKQAYSNKWARRQDQHLLNSERGNQIVETYREAFDAMGTRLNDTYQKQIDKLFKELPTDTPHYRVFKNFYDSEQSFKQWKDSMDEGRWREQLDEVKDDDLFTEAVSFREQQLKLKNLEGRYVPQVVNSEKLAAEKGKWWDANRKSFDSDADAEEAWAKQLQQNTIDYNTKGYVGQDISGSNVETKFYKNERVALKDLKDSLVYKIQDPAARRQAIKHLQSGDPLITSKYIGKSPDGKAYIKNPPEQTLDYNILKDFNEESIGKAQRQFLNKVMTTQSNHLDNARNYLLPAKILETDMDKVVDMYTRDVGLKAHFIDEGLGTERQLNNSLRKLKNQLQDKKVDDIPQKMDRIRSWYAAMSKTSDSVEMGMSKSQILARRESGIKNHKFMNTLMNLSSMRFMWFTTFYSWATPMIMGPYSSSFKNIARSYKDNLFKNPERLVAIEDHLYKTGAIKKKLNSVSSFHQKGRESFSGSNSFLDKLHSLSENLVEVSTNFSPVKSIMNKAGIDHKNSGMLRMFSGDIYDVSGAEGSLVVDAVFRELEDMTQAGVKLLDGGKGEVKVGGKRFRLGDIKQKLSQLGVENPEEFIKKSQGVTNDVKSEVSPLSGYYKKMTGQADEYKMDGNLRGEYDRIVNHTLSNYFGRTKTTRPLKWIDNGLGRLLSQFSVYSQNFGVHTVEQRMYRPLKNWTEKYPSLDEEASLFEMYSVAQKGDDARMKEIFGSKTNPDTGNPMWVDAYNDFPVAAVDNIFKVTPVAMGVGGAMLASRNATLDLIDMSVNETLGNGDYESWKRTKREYGNAGDYFDTNEMGWDTARLFGNGLAQAVEMGYFQRLPQVIYQMRYKGGVAGTNPVTSMLDDWSNFAGQQMNYSVDTFKQDAPRDWYDFAAGQMPVGGTFTGVQDAVGDAIFKKPKNRDKQEISKDELRL